MLSDKRKVSDKPTQDTDVATSLPGEASPAAADDIEQAPLSTVEPQTRWPPVDIAELWRYRELLYFFTWRDLKVRYKQTALGPAWAVIPPLVTTGIFTVLFSLLMGKGEDPGAPGVSYALSTFCAMLPWRLFASSLAAGSNSLVVGEHLITKVYFPRLILPVAAILPGLLDFAIAFLVLLVMMAFYGTTITWTFLALPLFIIWASAASLGFALWIAPLAVVYRDVRNGLPFLLQLGMYVSPVIYATTKIQGNLPEWALFIYGLNPMVGIIEGFRWALLGTDFLPAMIVVPSLLTTAVALITGVYFFCQMEGDLVDVI